MFYDYFQRGDRAYGPTYEIMQFNDHAFRSNINGGFVKVGHWADDGDISDFYQLCDDGRSPSLGPQEVCTYSVIYNTPDNSRPADRPPPLVVQVDHPKSLFVFGAVLTAILLAAAGLIYAYQKESLIKTAQPTIMLLITLGELIGAIRVIITGLDLSTSVCVVQEVLGHLAFWLVFTPFLLRTWRVNRVMNTATLSRVKVTLLDILRYTAYIYAAVIIYLVVSVGIDQPSAGYFEETVDNQLYRYTTCDHSLIYVSYPLLGLEAMALSYSVWLAYAAKDLPQAFNEFYEALLSAVGIGVIAAVMLFELTKIAYPTSSRFYVGICFGLGVAWTAAPMLYYKIVLVLLGYKVSDKYDIRKVKQSQTSLNFVSKDFKVCDLDESDPFVKDCMRQLRHSHNDDTRFAFVLDKIALMRTILVMINEGYFQLGAQSSFGAGAARGGNMKVYPQNPESKEEQG